MTNWSIPSEGQRRVVVSVPGNRPGPVFHDPTSLVTIARGNFRHEAQTVLEARHGYSDAGRVAPLCWSVEQATGNAPTVDQHWRHWPRLGGESQVLGLRNLRHLDLQLAR